jgi:3-oxoacyl-[acyl-carrier protein] reductase
MIGGFVPLQDKKAMDGRVAIITTVNAIAPGPIASAMTPGFPTALQALIPVGRMGKATEVAAAAKFLASDDAAFITGEVLDVNGGMWAD